MAMSDKQQTARKFLRYIKRFFQKAMAPALDPRPGHPLIDPHAVSPYPRQRHDTFVTGFDGPPPKRRISDFVAVFTPACARFDRVMAAVCGALSSAPGFFFLTGPSTRTQLPPIRLTANGGYSNSKKERFHVHQ